MHVHHCLHCSPASSDTLRAEWCGEKCNPILKPKNRTDYRSAAGIHFTHHTSFSVSFLVSSRVCVCTQNPLPRGKVLPPHRLEDAPSFPLCYANVAQGSPLLYICRVVGLRNSRSLLLADVLPMTIPRSALWTIDIHTYSKNGWREISPFVSAS